MSRNPADSVKNKVNVVVFIKKQLVTHSNKYAVLATLNVFVT